MPFVAQPVLVPEGEPASGHSYNLFSSFLSPRESGGTTWGVGLVFSLPTTTDPMLGSGKWSIGPTAVVLRQTGR